VKWLADTVDVSVNGENVDVLTTAESEKVLATQRTTSREGDLAAVAQGKLEKERPNPPGPAQLTGCSPGNIIV
jgi:hypothetical protein